MVEATTIVGLIGMLATALMILVMLYLTFLGARSDRRDPGLKQTTGDE